ncbi:neural Wiskott-Aldrich syndrome protein-like [Melanotaenia boesemani]|uniref:neural Wiskott-Aldrich syndrome protein-like n=1 Tax=Melanotaenia boesemani TaxID=1250792 RepID=UPI001C049EFE|nr:neural Wiskott-Aldrich syndrome protein-like [Melanotaenia boesemani]
MNMVIPPPPPPPLPPLPSCKNMPSKLPPPIPKHAAVPWNPVQETGGPPQDSQGAEQDGAQAPLQEGPEDGLWDDEKENHPVQETEPESEALGTSQGVGQDPGQDEAIPQLSGGEGDHLP